VNQGWLVLAVRGSRGSWFPRGKARGPWTSLEDGVRRRAAARSGCGAYDQPNDGGGSVAWSRSGPAGSSMEVAVGIVAWIVLGAIAGWITNLIMGGGEGVIATIILGIVGAVVGGWLAGTVLNIADVTGINITSIVVSVIGAIIVVAVYRFVMRRRTAV